MQGSTHTAPQRAAAASGTQQPQPHPIFSPSTQSAFLHLLACHIPEAVAAAAAHGQAPAAAPSNTASSAQSYTSKTPHVASHDDIIAGPASFTPCPPAYFPAARALTATSCVQSSRAGAGKGGELGAPASPAAKVLSQYVQFKMIYSSEMHGWSPGRLVGYC